MGGTGRGGRAGEAGEGGGDWERVRGSEVWADAGGSGRVRRDVDPLGQLERWLAEARVDEAARARSRERWLRRQAEEEAAFAGVLVDLAEREAEVVLQTTSGRTHRGRLVAVGRDFCLLRSGGRGSVLVALEALATVRGAAGTERTRAAEEATGDRLCTLDVGLGDVLAGLAGERPHVVAVVQGGETPIAGELRAAGVDVVTIRVETQPPTTVYMRLASVTELSLGLVSG